MNTFKHDDNALNDSCDLSFNSLIEDKSEVSITCKNASSISGNKVNYTSKNIFLYVT